MSNFGADLIFASQKQNIKNENDVIIIVIHWILCKNEGLRNVGRGIGDSRVFSEADKPSELLPTDWNEDSSSYKLRYALNQKIYLLYGNRTESGDLLTNLLDATKSKTSSAFFEVGKIVKSLSGDNLEDFVNDSEGLIKQINDELLKPIFKKPRVELESGLGSAIGVVFPPRLVSPRDYDETRDPCAPERDPVRDIGRGDLDPFGRGGGGMLFQPPRPLPYAPFRPGAPLPSPQPAIIPPGARYDPPNPFNRLDPDNDHLPPPGQKPEMNPGSNDMYM